MLDNLPATSTPARTLGEFACGLTFEHIPAAVLERAKLLILDALGCGIASNAYGFSDAALAGATALGGVGRCSVIGRARSCSPASEVRSCWRSAMQNWLRTARREHCKSSTRLLRLAARARGGGRPTLLRQSGARTGDALSALGQQR